MHTIAPSPHLTSVAAARSSSAGHSGPAAAVAARRRTPCFAVGMRIRGDGRDVELPWLLSKQRNGGLSCGKDSGARPASSEVDNSCGIGIAEFLEGKNFLVTGGTGFLGKVLIEKILRTNPNVGKIYVMIKAKDAEAASKRLQNEVVDKELFKCLQESHGKDYHLFVSRKLVPVVGDIRETNLGIAPELANEIMEEVDIIVNSAGNTNFHERYDVAVDSNTLGPFRVISFAHKFPRLELFMHVSTAYVNGKREGVVLEKPFRLGDTIAKELGSSGALRHSNEVLDIEAEIKLAFDPKRHSDESASFSQQIRDLGLQRANLHGWQDTYVFTKAMGEMAINCMRGDIPVVVIRPSIIESTWRDPFPGWIQGNRMVDPVIISYGKGLMRSFLGDPECVLDMIPADMVVNAMLASMAKHGRVPGRAEGMHVYHVSSGTLNPLVSGDMFRFFFQHFTQSPLIDAAGQPIQVQPMWFCKSMEQYARDVETNILQQSSGTPASLKKRHSQRARHLQAKTIERIIHLGRIYEPYTFYGGRFDRANTEALLAEMSDEERIWFPFDARSVDWMDYFTNVHIPGVKKHIMTGSGVAAKRPLTGVSM